MSMCVAVYRVFSSNERIYVLKLKPVMNLAPSKTTWPSYIL